VGMVEKVERQARIDNRLSSVLQDAEAQHFCMCDSTISRRKDGVEYMRESFGRWTNYVLFLLKKGSLHNSTTRILLFSLCVKHPALSGQIATLGNEVVKLFTMGQNLRRVSP